MYNLTINPIRSVSRLNQVNSNRSPNRSRKQVNINMNKSIVTFSSRMNLLEQADLSDKVIKALSRLSAKAKEVAEPSDEIIENSIRNIKVGLVSDDKHQDKFFLNVIVARKPTSPNQDPDSVVKFSRYTTWGKLSEILNTKDKGRLSQIIESIKDGIEKSE